MARTTQEKEDGDNGVGSFSVGFPTSVMESLCSGQGLLRERCAVLGVGGRWRCSQAYCRRCMNLVLLLFLSTPHHGHTFVAYAHINTTIQPIHVNP